jgi:putative DNA primase/helicase
VGIDFNDVAAAGDAALIADSIEKAEAVEAAERDDRARIVVRRGRIDETVDATESALIEHGAPLYVRGELAVRLARGVEDKRIRRSSTAPVLQPLTPPALREEIDRVARFVVKTKTPDPESGELVERTRTIECPGGVASVYLARIGAMRLPQVFGIAEAPILTKDGRIVVDGYDLAEAVLVIAPGHWSSTPSRPTKADAKAAIVRLFAPFEHFPFRDDVDKSVTLAAMLSVIARPTLPSCPAFALTAPVRGSGKSKIADMVATLGTGRSAAAMAWANDDAENEKRLASAVLAGDSVVLIDNVESTVRSPLLCSVLTQETVALRPLGRSEVVRVANRALIVTTGNNLAIAGDLTRRFLIAEIDPQSERPETRKFPFDPVERVRAERRMLVADALTVLRYGMRIGQQATPLGSFEEWSRRVRDPLIDLGYADPCKALDRLVDDDPEREIAMALIASWHSVFAGTPTNVNAALAHAERDRSGALHAALDAVAGGAGGINARRVGRYLLRIKDRYFGDAVIRQGRDSHTKTATWRVDVRRPLRVVA